MFATARSYRVAAGSIDALMHRIDRDFAEALTQEPGFVSYQALEIGHEQVMTVSVFSTREQAQDSNELAARWVADELADFEIERLGVSGGEVMVSRASEQALVPEHH
ncbi:MAG: hypothetical protein JWO90_230 [Solirubrobacterales bacterium]|jgi:hypothetical protein|nr:hypothetical protein [Solirubrobacterales bacterium]